MYGIFNINVFDLHSKSESINILNTDDKSQLCTNYSRFLLISRFQLYTVKFNLYLIATKRLGASLQLELGRSGLGLDREPVVQAEDPGHLVAPEAGSKPGNMSK